MTWHSLHQLLERDHQRLAQPHIDLPPGDALTATLNSELEWRLKLDAWIEAHYLRQEQPMISRELSYWLGWRLCWAIGWLSPLAFGPTPSQAIDEREWIPWLLLKCWPLHGVDELEKSVRADVFGKSAGAALPPPLPPRHSDGGISFPE